MAGHTQPENVEMGTAPGEGGPTRALPDVAVNELAGLLENLDDATHNRADIYRLEQDLKLDTDSLLRLTEAAELLGVNNQQNPSVSSRPATTTKN